MATSVSLRVVEFVEIQFFSCVKMFVTKLKMSVKFKIYITKFSSTFKHSLQFRFDFITY